MDRRQRRISSVSDALVELRPPIEAFNTAQGFEELYRNTFPRVYAYVASLLRDRGRAADVRIECRHPPPPCRRKAQEGMQGMNPETTNILIDTALASGSASALDPEERALQELVLALHDDAPTPAADFRLRMDARVAAGFPPRRARSLGLRLPALAWQRPRLAALGAVASVLIAI